MLKNQPRVSIGLPVYNGEKFLRKTLDSILNQSFQDFEVIICDNASTDSTTEICQEYALKDKRIRYYRNEENLGAARNYNLTFELSNGEYFKWSACDDLLAPEFLAKCVEVLDKNPSVILSYTREYHIDEQDNIIDKRFADILNLRSSKPHQRFQEYHDLWLSRGFTCGNPVFGLIRANCLQKTPLIGSYEWADIGLLGELILLGEFYEIPEYLFFFRCHENTSRANRESGGQEALAVWYNPKNAGKILSPEWRLFWQQLQSVNRVEMNWYEKVSCYGQISKWFSWKWKRLGKELMVVILQMISRINFWQSSSLKQNNC
ncbi:MAG: glycosyltransferase family 2 protein [Nostocaceae cyanobacterium]|nr:glycosyltransferase family 2 protein [Nostocaceae cyanobacterium]